MKIPYAALCVIMVVLLSEAHLTKAVTCSPLELSSCFAAITSSAPPSSMCCSKLREQRPCLCGYIRDPNLSQYVNSANARRVASTCGVPFPNC
ncbi:hypothetical protein VitviT2T_021841 [Vitis vinifera]|nr:Non-specific lipid-transfer protein 2 [Vitis vinifera]WKA03752.1 hypothetical protein VitviT2T_021841 [Vitis vinifera]|eukprot:XP_002284213.1 PREDICTED: non-specific lipid-transfer protein 2 [Vitis vinifera]